MGVFEWALNPGRKKSKLPLTWLHWLLPLRGLGAPKEGRALRGAPGDEAFANGPPTPSLDGTSTPWSIPEFEFSMSYCLGVRNKGPLLERLWPLSWASLALLPSGSPGSWGVLVAQQEPWRGKTGPCKAL